MFSVDGYSSCLRSTSPAAEGSLHNNLPTQVKLFLWKIDRVGKGLDLMVAVIYDASTAKCFGGICVCCSWKTFTHCGLILGSVSNYYLPLPERYRINSLKSNICIQCQ